VSFGRPCAVAAALLRFLPHGQAQRTGSVGVYLVAIEATGGRCCLSRAIRPTGHFDRRVSLGSLRSPALGTRRWRCGCARVGRGRRSVHSRAARPGGRQGSLRRCCCRPRRAADQDFGCPGRIRTCGTRFRKPVRRGLPGPFLSCLPCSAPVLASFGIAANHPVSWLGWANGWATLRCRHAVRPRGPDGDRATQQLDLSPRRVPPTPSLGAIVSVTHDRDLTGGSGHRRPRLPDGVLGHRR
jgi:hypothetical protein